MFVRLAINSDEDSVVEMARMAIEETRPELRFDERQARASFRSYMEKADPTVFVVEDRRAVIAFLLAGIHQYRAASGLCTAQEVIFVRPEKRGTRAAAILMKQFIAWSETFNPVEIIGGVGNSFQTERTAKFLERFGFRRVGYAMKRVAANAWR